MSPTSDSPVSAAGTAKRVTRRGFLLGSLAASGALLAGCWFDPMNPDNRDPNHIRIGSAAFPESEIIARLWAGALAGAGYNVTVIPQIGARDVYLSALTEGAIDIVPEYSGNLLAFYEDISGGATESEILQKLKTSLPVGLSVASSASAESKDAYWVTEAVSSRGVTSIRDLNELDQVRVGGSPELAQRPYGIPGLTKIYGIAPEKLELTAYGDSGGPLTMKAVVDGAVDTADIYTTTPLFLPDGSPAPLVQLDDPENMILPQNVVALIRTEANQEKLNSAINAVNSQLTTADLVAMNERSSGAEKASAELIAKDWLRQKKIPT